MKRKFTFLMAVAVMLLVFMTPSIAGWGQTRATKTEGFETAPNSTTYNSTQTYTTSQSDCGIGWSVYYGSVSTTGPITGTKSCLIRYYTADAVLGYAKTTTGIQGLSNITFNAKVTNTGNKMGVWYSTDGENWNALATDVVLASSAESKSYDIPNPSSETTYFVKIGLSTGSTTNKKDLIIDDVVFTYSTGSTPTTYTVTFDAGDGAFVGNTDFPDASNTGVTGGSHTLPSATPPMGYNFDGWTATGVTTPVTGTYNVNADIDFTASYSNANEHTYSFAGANNFYTDLELTTHPSSGSSNNVGTIYYGDGKAFVATGTSRYFSSASSGYFFLGKSGAQISLPTFSGYKITQVKLHTSGSCSTNVKVSIVSGTNTASDEQQWSTNSDFTYNIASDYQSSALSVNVTNAYNAQFTSITIVCQADNAPSLSVTTPDQLAFDANEGSIGFTINNPVNTASVHASVPGSSWITLGTVGANSVPFTCSANAATTARSETVTFTYVNGDQTLDTKEVTVTQAGNPNAVVNISSITSTGSYNVQGTIVAISNRGFVLGDGTGYVYYYYGSEFNPSNYSIGDKKKLSGDVTVYGGVYQFDGNTAITTVESSNYVSENPTVLTGAQMDARVASTTPAQLSNYVQYQGVLSVNNTYYNISGIDGANTAIGSISYPTNTDFTSLDGKAVIVKGYYVGVSSSTYYNTMLGTIEEVVTPTITLTPNAINATAAETDGTINVTYNNLTNYLSEVQFTTSDGVTPATYGWLDAEIRSTDNTKLDYTIGENTNSEDRVAYMKVYAVGDEGEAYSSLVTINQAGYVAPPTGYCYKLYTGELVEGDYLIVYNGNAMNNIVNSNRLQFEEVSATNDVITTNNAAIVWHIAPSGNYWTIFNDDANAYAASTGTKSQAQMLGDGTDDKALWTASGTETYEFVNKYNATNSVNANLRKNGTYGFACYSDQTGGALSLYKRVAVDINGYGTSTKAGYVLIASPVTADPATAGMITDNYGSSATQENSTYDLYYFDHEYDGAEWRNYRQGSFNLEPGKGYLYSNKNTVNITFSGTLYNGNGVITLDSVPGTTFAGWNLIGNPLTGNATLNKPFFRMNELGDGFVSVTEGSVVYAMEGVFVKGKAGQTATFTAQTSKGGRQSGIAKANLNVIGANGNVIDNAIVRFDEGQTLEKFMLHADGTKIFFTEDHKDFAIVRSNAQGQMPVNFKAAADGTYTISVETENLEVNYLHLIDNLTGMDVDLLATPSYTFEARKSDIASRFRLVFDANTGNDETNDNFAFINNGELIVNGNGTVQVIDILGRQMFSHEVNSSFRIQNSEFAPGVYVLRLVNGNDVKTQKIVIK